MKEKARPFSKIIELASSLGGKCLIVNEAGEVLGAFLTPGALKPFLNEENVDFSLKIDKKSESSDKNNDPLTEKEILDRINRELQEWEQGQSLVKAQEIEAELEKEEGKGEEEDRYYLEPVD